MADLSLAFDVVGRDKGSAAFKSVGDASDGLFSKLKGLGGFLAGGAIAGAAVQAGKSIVGMFSDAINEAREGEKIARITENAIKATGGAANVTAGQVGDLAGRLAMKTAVDDELIQSGANLILTFKNIRNEAGKGNDIFDQTTKAALDLSAAGFGSVESASIQLGKALNDPLKGITALAKSGVTFTEQQKKQIAELVKTGDLLGAQKIILGEINAQVGGAAEAAADPMARLQVVVGNVKEELGARLLPVVARVGEFLADRLPAAMDLAERAFGRASEFVAPVAELIGKFWNTLNGMGDKGIGLVIDVASMFGIAEDDPRLNGFITAVERVEDVVGRVVGFVRDNLQAILIGVGIALATLTAPITTVVAGLAFLYLRFELVRNIVDTVAAFLVERFQMIAAFTREIWPDVEEVIGHAVAVVSDLITTTLDRLQLAWSIWGDDIMNVVRGVFGIIHGVIEVGVGTIQNVVRVFLAVMNGDWGKAWDLMKQAPQELVGGVQRILGGLGDVVRGILGGVFDALREVAGDFVDLGVNLVAGFIRGIKSMAGDVVRAIKDAITDKLPGFVKTALDIRSPSGVMKRLGEQAAAGFAIGVGDLGAPFQLTVPSLAGGLGATEQPVAMPTFQVFIGDRELTDIVRVEVRGQNGELVDATRAGTGRIR